jgi:hypothetical protein
MKFIQSFTEKEKRALKKTIYFFIFVFGVLESCVIFESAWPIFILVFFIIFSILFYCVYNLIKALGE